MSMNVITVSVIGFPINSHNFAVLSSVLTGQQIVFLPWLKEYASICKQMGHDIQVRWMGSAYNKGFKVLNVMPYY